MNRKTLSIVAASLVVAGALGAQQPKVTAKKVTPAVVPASAAPAATVASAAVAPIDTTHKKHTKKGAKKVAKHDSTVKHDSTHATPKKHKPS